MKIIHTFNYLKITAMDEHLSMDQVFISKLTKIVQANLSDEKFSVEELIREAGISNSSIHRKLRSITNKSASQFIREIRLQSAMEMLQKNVGTVSEIAYMTGFGSPTYFNKCFHDYYGYPPGEVKKRGSLNSETGSISLDIKPLESDKQLSYKGKISSTSKSKILTVIIGTTILIISIILILSFVLSSSFRKDNFTDFLDKDGRIPLAIMPFKNLTNDSTKNYLQDWIMDDLNSSLSDYPDEIEVRQKESVHLFLQSREISNYASITPSVAKAISKKLNVKIYITGSIKQEGNTVRINAQLHRSKTGSFFKSFEIDGSVNEKSTILITDSLRKLITNFLLISVMRKELSKEYVHITFSTSPKAYENFTRGYKAFYNHDFPTACEYLTKATEIDSNFAQAYILLTWSHFNQGKFNLAKECILRVYEKTDQMNDLDEYGTKEIYALYFQDPNERIKHIRCLLAIDDENPLRYENLGEAYWDLGQYDDALMSYEKQLKIYKKWGIRPRWIESYYKPANLYFQMGKFKEARKLYRKAEKDFPEMNPNIVIIRMQAMIALSEGKTKAANTYFEKFKNIRGDDHFAGIANIYEKAGMLDSAEVYYRKHPSLRTNAYWLWRYASLLINNDINIEEGLSIIDESLQLDPDNYNALHTKAWGLFKAGKFEEALKFILRSDSLKPIYNSNFILHKQEIEKAVASQMNN